MKARDIALIITESGLNVARRERDGPSKFAIVVKSVVECSKGESQWNEVKGFTIAQPDRGVEQ
jgi:hypothetical protein